VKREWEPVHAGSLEPAHRSEHEKAARLVAQTNRIEMDLKWTAMLAASPYAGFTRTSKSRYTSREIGPDWLPVAWSVSSMSCFTQAGFTSRSS
jgi:hypothetical protein